MKSFCVAIGLALTPAFASPSASGTGDWQAPTKGDVRGPCPMLNSLTNHGYLPRNGKGITKQMAVEVLSDVLNWDASVVNDLYDFAQPTNPTPNATNINLDELSTHNILEHDGSLSRQDANFGPADVFNETIWDETVSYFTGDTIDVAMASAARTARVVTSASTNPQFTLPQLGAHFDYGETAAYQFVFGKWDLEAQDPKDKVLTPKNLVQYFFANERLPYELGWKKPENRLVMNTLQGLVFNMFQITQEQMNAASAKHS
ncbi:hypothetical protein PG987_004880 [Apiospora arundinis]